jgi:arylsulfatase A-like enzyme
VLRGPGGALLVGAVVAALAGACRSTPATPRNLLLITVDTLRADHLGVYGNDLELTPAVDRLAHGSDVFLTTYTPAPFTLAAVSALMTGQYPDRLGVVDNTSVIPGGTPTLATRLHDAGWRTGAVTSSFVLRRAAGLASGFEIYDDALPEKEENRPVPERVAPETVDTALRVLDRLGDSGERFFLWVHFQDPHGPYTPPPDLRSRYLERERRRPDGERLLALSADDRGIGGIPRYQVDAGRRDVGWYRAGYDGEIRFMDQHLARLLDRLAERGLDRQTVVVFAADHGEGMGEGDYWFAHGEYLSDALLRVPLIVRLPGPTGEKHPEAASLLDVLPTLAHVLDVPLGTDMVGRDLFGGGESSTYLTTAGESTVPRVGLLQHGYKYVVSLEPGGAREELHETGHDDVDLASTRPEALAEMHTALAAVRERAGAAHATEQALTPRDREKLRALGYL